jgi:hypothetical protein
MIHEKNESRKGSTELSVYEKKHAGDKKWTTQNKLINQ